MINNRNEKKMSEASASVCLLLATALYIPRKMKCLLSPEQIFDRCASWEDPTKWVVLRYPWNKDHSRVLHTLRKLRQVDVVLNRNQLGSDNGKMTCS